MGNNTARQQLPPPTYKCCSHQKQTNSDNKCSAFGQYMNPCCIHLNTLQRIPICLHIKQFRYVLAFNAFQLVMILAYILSYILPTVVILPCALICLMCVYFQREQRQKKNMYLFFVILGGLDLVSQILVAIIPTIFISYQMIILGIIFFFVCNELNKNKSTCTSQKSMKASKARQVKVHEQSMILEQKCCICLVQNCQYVLLPCKHASYCRECVAKINQCSLCRVVIQDKVQMKG